MMFKRIIGVLGVLATIATLVDAGSTTLPSPFMSGFVDVEAVGNATEASSLFWLLTPQKGCAPPCASPDVPTIVWLQGGPGCSMSMGLFSEVGPWSVSNETGTPVISERERAWTDFANVLFFDSPAGAGFSRGPIPTTSREVGLVLRGALANLLGPAGALVDLAASGGKFFVFGESWSGMTIPQLVTAIDEAGPTFPVAITGVGIGDGISDPVRQVAHHASFSFEAGLINAPQARHWSAVQDKLVALISQGMYAEASSLYGNLTMGILVDAGFVDPSDIRYFGFTRLMTFGVGVAALNAPAVLSALGVPADRAYTESCADAVGSALAAATMQSVADLFPAILQNRPVLLYTGMFDFTIPPSSVYDWVSAMARTWLGSSAFDDAPRKTWKISGQTAGFIQSSHGLSLLVVPGGHMVPFSNPDAGYSMAKTFLAGGFSSSQES